MAPYQHQCSRDLFLHRCFNEESVFASTYGIASLEYRFMPNDGFYISVFGDYGFVENKSSGLNENLLGLGTGISFLTQLGVFNLSYAVGKQSDSSLTSEIQKFILEYLLDSNSLKIKI